MPLSEKNDFLFYDDAILLSSREPSQKVAVCLVCTSNYVFTIPKESVGIYVEVNTIVTNEYFYGVTIEEGIRNIVLGENNTEALEKKLKHILEQDEKYIFHIKDQKSFRFRGFLGNHTLRIDSPDGHWTSIQVSGKENSKELKQFYQEKSVVHTT